MPIKVEISPSHVASTNAPKTEINKLVAFSDSVIDKKSLPQFPEGISVHVTDAKSLRVNFEKIQKIEYLTVCDVKNDQQKLRVGLDGIKNFALNDEDLYVQFYAPNDSIKIRVIGQEEFLDNMK